MIYLLYGEDEFSIAEEVQRLRAAASEGAPAGFAGINEATLDAERASLAELAQACEPAPFLAARRVVIVRGLVERCAREPEFLDVFSTLAARLPESTWLIVTYVGSVGTPVRTPTAGRGRGQGRRSAARRGDPKAILEALQELPGVQAREFRPPEGEALQDWISARARARGVRLAPQAVALLASYVGSDLRALAQEIDKLAAYAGRSERPVQPHEVERLVPHIREADIFRLVDAVAAGRPREALIELRTLLSRGEAPGYLLAMLGRQTRLMLQIQELLSAHGRAGLPRRLALDQIRLVQSRLGLPQFVVEKTAEQALRYVPEQLAAMHRLILRADLQTKSSDMDPAVALELLVADLADITRRRPTPAGARAPA
jgi:DNA polymerase-3 subunit delta